MVCASMACTSPVSTTGLAAGFVTAIAAPAAANAHRASVARTSVRMLLEVMLDPAVAQTDLARRARGDVVVVGDQHDGLAVGVHVGDQAQHVGCALRIQV